MISVNPELSKNGFFSAPQCIGPQLGRWTARGNSTAGGWTHLEASSQTCSSHCDCGLGHQLGLLIREPTRIPYALGFLASWKPQGRLVSPMDFQSFKCESPCRQSRCHTAFYDAASEIPSCHLGHTLLVKAVINLPRVKDRRNIPNLSMERVPKNYLANL